MVSIDAGEWCQGKKTCAETSRTHFPLDGTTGPSTKRELKATCSFLLTGTDTADSCTAGKGSIENTSKSRAATNASVVDNTAIPLVPKVGLGLDSKTAYRTQPTVLLSERDRGVARFRSPTNYIQQIHNSPNEK